MWSRLQSETKIEPKFSLNQRLTDFVYRAVQIAIDREIDREIDRQSRARRFFKVNGTFLTFFVLKILCAVYLIFFLNKEVFFM